MRKTIPEILLTSLFMFIYAPHAIALADNNILINEFISHPSSGNKEWVEFYNPIGTDLSNYWLDDDTDFLNDSGNSTKKSLSTLIKTNPQHPYIELSSILNNDGDRVVLFDNSGNILDQYEYTADSGEDIAIGRTPDGAGQIQALIEGTKGNSNSGPAPTSTPTPAPTSPPAKEPTPTKTTLVQPTKIPILSPTRSFAVTKPASKSANISAVPTSILGAAVKPTKIKDKPKKTLVESANQRRINTIAIIIGSIFLLACAIIVYFRIEKSK